MCLAALTVGCEDQNSDSIAQPNGFAPVVQTLPIAGLQETQLLAAATIVDDGGSFIRRKGFCWSKTAAPTVAGDFRNAGTGNAGFTSLLFTGLTTNTSYYLRAYAENDFGLAYGNEIIFTTPQGAGGLVTDVDGNTYNTVGIGNQVWFTSDLRTTKLRNNAGIPVITNENLWASTNATAMGWYENNANASQNNGYGAFYNGHAVATGLLCPTGWRVPTNADFDELAAHLGGNAEAGVRLKQTGLLRWQAPNEGATNESGFDALPTGNRNALGGFFVRGNIGYWWTSSTALPANNWYRSLQYNSVVFYKDYSGFNNGFCVRCIQA